MLFSSVGKCHYMSYFVVTTFCDNTLLDLIIWNGASILQQYLGENEIRSAYHCIGV